MWDEDVVKSSSVWTSIKKRWDPDVDLFLDVMPKNWSTSKETPSLDQLSDADFLESPASRATSMRSPWSPWSLGNVNRNPKKVKGDKEAFDEINVIFDSIKQDRVEAARDRAEAATLRLDAVRHADRLQDYADRLTAIDPADIQAMIDVNIAAIERVDAAVVRVREQ
ncbi:hypothetical protein HRG_005833 [Hirsutella rhossiliensis]|uniref:Uncharacterized protein n=1 Tax=Hirsutella rhossiliensis TaxID=111463 RepID=A0A9P8MW41_9HYPO|nr:uncharacterized protein HRG_05833 [Hirsutella rhossiliensis]KAH0963323.1 hypothetical protein HRG_05833 [Hirsutella rhossiliensis]